MKLSHVLFAFVLGFLCVHAQIIETTTTNTDNDGNVVVRVRVEGNMDEAESNSSFRLFRPFHMFSRRHEAPRMLSFEQDQDPFASLFENLFKLDDPFAAPAVNVQVVRSDDDDDDDDDDRQVFSPLSQIFSRLSAILNAMREETANGNFQAQMTPSGPRKSARRQGGCTLLQACGKDIDSLCAYAKRLNIAQAIPRCLVSHRLQLSDTCGSYIDRFYSKIGEESSLEDSEMVEATIAESEISEASQTSPKTPQESCHATASQLCPNLPAHNMVAVMSCLYRNREQVPQLCLDHIKETAAFNCAVDAERFCAGVTNRRAIGQCLKPHMKELSSSCVAAAHKLAKLKPATSRLTSNVKAAAETPAQQPYNFFVHHSVALGLGVGAFVVMAVVAAIVVVVRRRRRAQRIRLPAVSTVQLVNPSN